MKLQDILFEIWQSNLKKEIGKMVIFLDIVRGLQLVGEYKVKFNMDKIFNFYLVD